MVQAVFPDARVFIRTARASRRSDREAAQHIIQLNWHRMPPAWQSVAEPLLQFGEEGLVDGSQIRALSISTIELLSNLVFEACRSCGDLVWGCGFNSVFEPDAGDDFGEVVKAA